MRNVRAKFPKPSYIRPYIGQPRNNKARSKPGYVVDSYGVADGARTHDNRNHNPGLYQLSYSHRKS